MINYMAKAVKKVVKETVKKVTTKASKEPVKCPDCVGGLRDGNTLCVTCAGSGTI